MKIYFYFFVGIFKLKFEIIVSKTFESNLLEDGGIIGLFIESEEFSELDLFRSGILIFLRGNISITGNEIFGIEAFDSTVIGKSVSFLEIEAPGMKEDAFLMDVFDWLSCFSFLLNIIGSVLVFSLLTLISKNF
jgi:hypothetical protein